MQAKHSRMPYRNGNEPTLPLLVLVIFCLAYSSCNSGCIYLQKPSQPEPLWLADEYTFSGDKWFNADGDSVDCGEPRIHDMRLVPAENLKKAVEKFDRCEVWK